MTAAIAPGAVPWVANEKRRRGDEERKRREEEERRRKGKGEETKTRGGEEKSLEWKNPLLGFFAGIILCQIAVYFR